MKIAKESWIIAAIGAADLITTIIFIRHHGAREANPLFQRYWEMGIMTFILAKLACLIGPLAILEWARRHRPRFVSFGLRMAIAGYLVFYGVGVFHLNGPAAAASEIERQNQPIAFGSPHALWRARLSWFLWRRHLGAHDMYMVRKQDWLRTAYRGFYPVTGQQ